MAFELKRSVEKLEKEKIGWAKERALLEARTSYLQNNLQQTEREARSLGPPWPGCSTKKTPA